MALKQEFERLMAAARRRKSGDGVPMLHCAIGGPARSGKTTQAKEYVDALAERGVIVGVFKLVSCAQQDGFLDFETVFRTTQRGAVIIDEVEKANPNSALIARAKQAMASGECLVIFTGTAEGIEKLVKNDPALDGRLHVVMTERSFTPEECNAYEVRETTALRRDVQVMKPVRLVKKP